MAAAAGQVEVIDSRRLGGAWVLGQLWERLEIGRAIRKVAAGRRLDGEAAERVIFALVAQRALEPGSKLAATRGVTGRVAAGGCPGFSEDAAHAAMDFLLAALDEIASQIFGSVAHLLNLDLDLDIVFAATTSTYGSARSPASSPGWPKSPPMTRPASPPYRAPARSGTPRTTAATCRRWSSRWRSPVTGSRCAAGPSPATPPIRRSSAPSRTAWTAGTCAAWSGWPTGGSPRRRTGPTSPAAAGTTSTPGSSATPTPRPPRRWPARAATTPWPGTCGSRRCGCLPGSRGSGPGGS